MVKLKNIFTSEVLGLNVGMIVANVEIVFELVVVGSSS